MRCYKQVINKQKRSKKKTKKGGEKKGKKEGKSDASFFQIFHCFFDAISRSFFIATHKAMQDDERDSKKRDDFVFFRDHF